MCLPLYLCEFDPPLTLLANCCWAVFGVSNGPLPAQPTLFWPFIFLNQGLARVASFQCQAIRGVTPDIAVKARRVGGSTHQVPVEIGSTQGKALAIRWLLGASRKRPGRNMAFKLSSELVDAAKGSGGAIRKKEATHRMAEANRALAHFR